VSRRSLPTRDDEGEEELDSARLDVWLWRARFFKTRTLATRFVDTGRVRVTREAQLLRGRKPGFAVAIGDVLTFTRRGRVECLRVLAIPSRRGPASEARGLYQAVDLGDTGHRVK
jgi:ribosome-associated heat shock protein Hsp15